MIRYCFAAVLVLGLNPAFAQPGSPPPASAASPTGTHTLNLQDADIAALIKTVSDITGKNFIVGPNVQGKVTVVSAKPMKPDEIYDVFLSVLRVHGYAAIPAGSMIKIVPEAMAQQDGSGGLNGTHGHEPDELVTQIVPVKHVSANELVPILPALMPQGAQLIPHPGPTHSSFPTARQRRRVVSISGVSTPCPTPAWKSFRCSMPAPRKWRAR